MRETSVDVYVKTTQCGACVIFTTSIDVELWKGMARYQHSGVVASELDAYGESLLHELIRREDPYFLKLDLPSCGQDGRKTSYFVTLQAHRKEWTDQLQRSVRLHILNYYTLNDYHNSVVVDEKIRQMSTEVAPVAPDVIAYSGMDSPKCTARSW